MWAKIAGRPWSLPLKARTFPSEGNGDCSGILTSAEKRPSPINELRQAASASELVEGLMRPRRQTGIFRLLSLPCELIAIWIRSSFGRAPALVAAMWPATETLTGTDSVRGSWDGVILPATQ